MKKESSKIVYEVPASAERHPHTVPWIIAAVFALCVLGYGVWQYGPLDEGVYSVPVVSPEGNLGAYDAALVVAQKEAKAWQSSALVASFEPRETTNERGDALTWRFIFTSSAKEDVGYIVEVKDGEVTFKEEATVNALGVPMPSNAKTIDEAIAEVRAMSGRADAHIEGVEALSNEDGVWYWGVRTGKGTISVKMEK